MPWSFIVPIAASLISGAVNSDAAGQAAGAQVAGADAAVAEQRRQFDITERNNEPFLKTGTAANARLRQLLGLDTDYTGADSGSLVRKFGASDLATDPVYNSGLQFGLDTGTKGINARAIGSGMYDSGATLRALTQFGNDYGSTKAGDAYNRYNTDQTNAYNRYAGISGTGQNAVNTVATAGTNAANNISANLTGAGNARSAGIVGGANAWGSAAQNINGVMNNYNSNQTLQRLIGGNNSAYNGWQSPTGGSDGYGGYGGSYYDDFSGM